MQSMSTSSSTSTSNDIDISLEHPSWPAQAPTLDSFSTQVEVKIGTADEILEPESHPTSFPITHEVRHEVAIPDGYPYQPISSYTPIGAPAREYPFQLDPFQRLSIACIEREESVLVAAHTSAGKTVIAEYAIAKALQQKQRVIYTSPIKALSNQKYREMNEIFGDVGLLTGDVSLNSTASCLVMTTEILRSMLYKGSEILREVSWVIFDEIHYMRDKERGVVWEETLILLPDSVRHVFLSATIPNAHQFARWICQIHKQPCHVVYTNFRPTPLQHYLFPSGANGIYLVLDENGEFKEGNFQKAISTFSESNGNSVIAGEKKPKKETQKQNVGKVASNIQKLIKLILSKNLHPAIIFSFSKKDCEALAMQVTKYEFNTEGESHLVEKVFMNAIEALSEEDRALPQISSILPLLKSGIGIHHSGLLPILKEVIEILFQEGLLKLLFATETFSIGLNMPARTVIFTSARKFDGQDFRLLTSGEYIQMSGRAGRRGLDTRGIVILMIEEKIDPILAKKMIKGLADPLNSAFHLSYNMILNLMRVEGTTPDHVLNHSFHQFQVADMIPDLEEQIKKQEKIVSESYIDDEKTIEGYYSIKEQLLKLSKDLKKVMFHPSFIAPFLQVGRLIQVVDGESDYGWCAIVNLHKSTRRAGANDVNLVIDVLAYCAKSDKISSTPKPSKGSDGEMVLIPVAMNAIDSISSVRIFMPKELRLAEQKFSVWQTIQEVKKRFPDGPPLLDPVNDVGIKDPAFEALVRRIETLEKSLFSHPLHKSPRLVQILEAYVAKKKQMSRLDSLMQKTKNAQAIVHLEELQGRKRFLCRMGYITERDVIETKGRVACEISSGDEILLTELIFSGFFNDLSPEQIAALLSSIVFEEKSDEAPKLREDLEPQFRRLQEIARKVAKVSCECRITLDAEDYVAKLRPDLIEVVYFWCKGSRFSKICKMTGIYEGSIIRCMRRLEELLRQMATASKCMGNFDLESKFIDSVGKLKRDIVFANSLYL